MPSLFMPTVAALLLCLTPHLAVRHMWLPWQELLYAMQRMENGATLADYHVPPVGGAGGPCSPHLLPDTGTWQQYLPDTQPDSLLVVAISCVATGEVPAWCQPVLSP